MNIQTSRQAPLWTRKTKALVAGLLLAAMVLAGMMAVVPARAATTFTVNSAGDAPDATPDNGVCDTDIANGVQCTLRGAMQGANTVPGADTINFNVPATRPVVISLGSPLPAITEQVTIDGYTQPGAHPNTLAVGDDATLRIVLDGQANGFGGPLAIENASNSVIKGLVLNRMDGDATAIRIVGDSVGNRIQGNFIGTDTSGTLDQSGSALIGVDIGGGASGNVVGGTTPAARNVISGINETGVGLGIGNNNRIQGNYIGTDRSGTNDLGNGTAGVVLFNTASGKAVGTTIGGTTAASRNVISGNGSPGFGSGIRIDKAQGTRVLGNRIGTTADSTAALGNGLDGVSISGDSTNNLIGDGTTGGSNTVAFNGDDGVDVVGSTATGNRISRNSIFSNTGLGIDLEGGFQNGDGVTANDAQDTDTGPNRLQNKPSLGSAKTISGKTTIKGTMSSRPGGTYTVQFFSNPSGTDEGRTFIGQKSVSTDGSGKGAFTFSPSSKVTAGRTITATATRTTTGDTSEFSTPRTVASL